MVKPMQPAAAWSCVHALLHVATASSSETSGATDEKEMKLYPWGTASSISSAMSKPPWSTHDVHRLSWLLQVQLACRASSHVSAPVWFVEGGGLSSQTSSCTNTDQHGCMQALAHPLTHHSPTHSLTSGTHGVVHECGRCFDNGPKWALPHRLALRLNGVCWGKVRLDSFFE